MTTYDGTPITGYGAGLITSDTPPRRVMTDRGDLPKGNKQNPNDWFTIDDLHYNVHPFDKTLGGYPVRWISSYIDGELVT